MQYDTDVDHSFYLTVEETNRFFDPYDPSDYEMPSHLHRAGHRYIKDDIYEWLENNVGQPQIDWCHTGGSIARTIQIKDAKKAMLFKLTWWNVIA